MSDADLFNLITVLGFLVAPISLSISLIALTGYIRFRNWRLLFLSVAFLLLAMPNLLAFIAYIGQEAGLSAWTVDGLTYAAAIFLTASLVPFAILAYVYYDEVRTHSITITRRQWAVGGLLLIVETGFIIFALATMVFTNGLSIDDPGLLLNLLFFLGTSIAYILIILIIVFLFAYYKAKKKKNTLVVMIGFICLLFGQGYGILRYLLIMITPDLIFGYGLTTSIQLAGYLAFLAALLRLKVIR